jgi:hypothetical protein
MTMSQEQPVVTDAPAPKKKPRTWSGPMAVLGVILGYACMLAAHGNGWSPLVWIALGLFGTPFLAWLLRRWMNPWPGRLIALATFCGLSFVLAKVSTRMDANDAYGEIFGARPPTGATMLLARKQWYDGIEYVVAFQSNRAGIDAMLATKKFGEDGGNAAGHVILGPVPYLDVSELIPPGYTNDHLWEYLHETKPGQWESVKIRWNESSGRGVIIGEWH